MNEQGAGRDKASIGLPPRIILYTLDQVAGMLAVTDAGLKARCYFRGTTTMRKMPKMLVAVDISVIPGGRPDWRISELELIRWAKACGFRVHRQSNGF